jgi:hypothetical protein
MITIFRDTHIRQFLANKVEFFFKTNVIGNHIFQKLAVFSLSKKHQPNLVFMKY